MTMPPLQPAAGPARQRGVSLIELMIAMAIGTLLLLGIVQVFSGTSNTFRANDALGRVQESGRFAMEFMRRDLRMAGHMGCINDRSHFAPGVTPSFATTMITNSTTATFDDAPFRAQFHISLEGFEAKGSGVGDDLTLTDTPVAGSAADWTPELPADLTGLGGGLVSGSDIVVVRYFSSEAIRSYDTPGRFSSPDAVNSEIEFAADIHQPFPLRAGATYAVADCLRALVFQASAFDGNTMQVQVGGLNAQNLGAVAGSFNRFREFFKAESTAFYVGISSTTGEPALFRATLQTDGTWRGEELVEGVENIQILYGADPDLWDRPTDYLTAAGILAQTGSDLENWRGVVSIKLGMIVRSPNTSSTPAPQESFSLLGTSIDPPDNSRQLRRSYENTIALRNRLRVP